MTVEPNNKNNPDTPGTDVAPTNGRVSTLANDGALGVESGKNSPARWLLVIVPAIILLAAVTNLLGVWTTSFQQAERDMRWRDVERTVPAGPNAAPPPAAEFAPAPHFPDALPNPPSAEAETPTALSTDLVIALLPVANLERGAQTFKMCMPCHNAGRDAQHKVGPNLWNIVGQDKARYPDFAYSRVLRAQGGTWTYEDLAQFLHDPRGYAPGTKMSFRGISDPGKIANLVAYLRTLSDNPAPLPD